MQWRGSEDDDDDFEDSGSKPLSSPDPSIRFTFKMLSPEEAERRKKLRELENRVVQMKRYASRSMPVLIDFFTRVQANGNWDSADVRDKLKRFSMYALVLGSPTPPDLVNYLDEFITTMNGKKEDLAALDVDVLDDTKAADEARNADRDYIDEGDDDDDYTDDEEFVVPTVPEKKQRVLDLKRKVKWGKKHVRGGGVYVLYA